MRPDALRSRRAQAALDDAARIHELISEITITYPADLPDPTAGLRLD
jgi:hypothetical protein